MTMMSEKLMKVMMVMVTVVTGDAGGHDSDKTTTRQCC